MAGKTTSNPLLDRRRQILETAMNCFARFGFHQTSMHDISQAAEISVGLIYRYFKNKEEVISALATEHKRVVFELLARAAEAPTLLEAMEILFTSHCYTDAPRNIAAFVVDLHAEASRNPTVARVVRDVTKVKTDGVARLIARSPEAKQTALSSEVIAEMIFAVNDGSMMRSATRPASSSGTRLRQHQLDLARDLWRLIFRKNSHANGHR